MKEAFTRKSLLILGRGIGQVMFQNNALSGLLMLIGIFLNSWQMGLLAVSGNIISTLTARISGYDCDDIKNGLYGFNGTLVGIAVGVFMLLTVSSLMLMAIASCASTLHGFSTCNACCPDSLPFLSFLYGCCWDCAVG
jgi:urea transporter